LSHLFGARRSLHSFPTRRSSDLAPLDSAAERLNWSNDGSISTTHPPRHRPPGRGRRGTEATASPRLHIGLPARERSHRFGPAHRSEEHTSELQSPDQLVRRLLLE